LLSPEYLTPNFRFRQGRDAVPQSEFCFACANLCTSPRSKVAQVSKPAVSPISKSAGAQTYQRSQVWKLAIQQTWKSALLLSRLNLLLPLSS
jgi:hypothetical protein